MSYDLVGTGELRRTLRSSGSGAAWSWHPWLLGLLEVNDSPLVCSLVVLLLEVHGSSLTCLLVRGSVEMSQACGLMEVDRVLIGCPSRVFGSGGRLATQSAASFSSLLLLAMAYWTRATALFALLAGLFLLVPGHGEGAAVVFQIEKLVPFGQGFVIAGNTAALGNWVPAQGAFMTVTGDRNWAVTVELTAATRVEYKPVRVVYDTREVLEWLPGSNLVLDVPSKGPIYVNVTFP
ncbi:hypothetical protein L7F22_056899 [Adiantum nelumboides]|nr:hypothetical protein [Adiantum nelumboides]